MLIISNVEKTFNKGTINEKKALNGVNLELQDGDFVTVIWLFGQKKCIFHFSSEFCPALCFSQNSIF